MNRYNNDNWKNIVLYNTQTKEILEGGIPVYIGAKVKWREDWFMGIQEAFGALARDNDLTGYSYKILNYLFSKLGFENYICITQQEISKELNIRKEHVSREVRRLTDKGIIFKGPKLGRTTAYRLNSEYGWRGSVKNLAQERIKTPKERMEELNLKIYENSKTQLSEAEDQRGNMKGSRKKSKKLVQAKNSKVKTANIDVIKDQPDRPNLRGKILSLFRKLFFGKKD